jgi:protein required for attachment to host cells
MTQLLILVANGSLARCFSRTAAHDPLVPLDTIDFPENRLKASELGQDRQGLGRSDNSSTVVHFEPRTSAREKRMHQFAQTLAKRLEQGVADQEYSALWLIASSPFLGELKAALSPSVKHRLQLVHEADFTSLDVSALEERLRDLPHSP